MPDVTAEAQTVYHISPLRLWLVTGFVIALGVLLLVCAGLSSADPDEQNALILTALFLFGCACLLYLLLRYSRLELSEQGVRVYQIGYTLETAWDNVAGLYDVFGAEGLVLHRPMQCRGASVLRGFRHTGAGAGLRVYNHEQVTVTRRAALYPDRGIRVLAEARPTAR